MVRIVGILTAHSRRGRPAPARPASHWRERGPLPNFCPACLPPTVQRRRQIVRSACHCRASRGPMCRHRDCRDDHKVPGRAGRKSAARPWLPSARASRPASPPGRDIANDLDMQELFDHIPVSGEDDPDVAEERSARGRAAETAASPPTRTKSSISVVTNKTFNKRPRTSADQNMQERFQFSFPVERRVSTRGGSRGGAAGETLPGPGRAI